MKLPFAKLERYLTGLDEATWNAGVLYDNRPVTIRNSIRSFARDYDNHRQRLQHWQVTTKKSS